LASATCRRGCGRFPVLSNGEQFRANLARVVCEAPARVVIDEFTSVVDRQIAKVGALAFQKSWRRTGGQAVLLSCHYDIVDWVEPDWVFDTATGAFSRGSLWRRPRFELEIVATDWRYWPLFEPHHYLRIPRMVGGRCYVGLVDGEPVCHLAVATKNYGAKMVEARGCRLVVMPEWQGAGVGMRFLNAVCQLQLDGGPGARLEGRRCTTQFHTSHPRPRGRPSPRPEVAEHIGGALRGRQGARNGVACEVRNLIDGESDWIRWPLPSRPGVPVLRGGGQEVTSFYLHDNGCEFSRQCRELALGLGLDEEQDPHRATVALAPLLMRILPVHEYAAPRLGTLIFPPVGPALP
jgi:GNAT superfamily N-acetyltransferase